MGRKKLWRLYTSLPASDDCYQESLVLLGLQMHHFNVCLDLWMAFLPVCLPASLLSSKNNKHIGLRATLTPFDLVFTNYLCQVSVLNKITFWGSKKPGILGRHCLIQYNWDSTLIFNMLLSIHLLQHLKQSNITELWMINFHLSYLSSAHSWEYQRCGMEDMQLMANR